MNDIARFLDGSSRVKVWPAKKELKLEILRYITSKFENGRFYTEREANEIIESWHTFGDYFMIRRGLVDCGLLTRTRNGSRYWKEETDECGEIIEIVDRWYDIGNIKSIFRISGGYGSNSYYILSDIGEFIFKDIEQNGMNHPENEALILCVLSKADIPVSEICAARNGDSVLKTQNKVYHLQKYVEGKTFKRNSAPQWLLYESARMLGKIQKEMEKIQPLPVGISQSFFDRMTPEAAINGYMSTLERAAEKGDIEIVNAVKSKMRMVKAIENFSFDVDKMACKNTHGDYKVQQIICGREKINAIIDFTSACVHPVCWELIRSYLSSDTDCRDGSMNIENFKRYISCFLEYGSLNAYDLKIMPYVYYYQNLVSDYFRQYLNSQNSSREVLLEDALLSVKQCEWFDRNITRLEVELTAGF